MEDSDTTSYAKAGFFQLVFAGCESKVPTTAEKTSPKIQTRVFRRRRHSGVTRRVPRSGIELPDDANLWFAPVPRAGQPLGASEGSAPETTKLCSMLAPIAAMNRTCRLSSPRPKTSLSSVTNRVKDTCASGGSPWNFASRG